MTNEEFQKLVLSKLTNLEGSVSKLEKGQAGLEKSVKRIEFDLSRLSDKFTDFQDETNNNFKYTNSMINQAFDRISENLSYQETVNEMQKVLTSHNFVPKQGSYSNTF